MRRWLLLLVLLAPAALAEPRITLPATTGPGGGYATIQQTGTPLTARTVVNFTGSGVVCVDDSVNGRTTCTINTGGAGAGNGASGVLDFGCATGGNCDFASVTVAAPWVSVASQIVCVLDGTTANVDHPPGEEDSLLEEIAVVVNTINAGVGFNVLAYAPNSTWGQYPVTCIGF